MSTPQQAGIDATTTGAPETNQNMMTVTTTDVPTMTASTIDENASSTTVGGNDMQTTMLQRAGDVMSTTRSGQNMDTTASTMNTSENPESNTIPMFETTVTQPTATEASTEASTEVSTEASTEASTEPSTTESLSSNMIDVETTTVIPTTTLRSRLIDFAQDILSRLQASLSTTVATSLDSTTTSPAVEMSNAIPDSSTNNSLEALSQLQGAGQAVTTDQSSLTTDETTTQSAIGSVPPPPPTTTVDPSSSMVPTQEANTTDESSPITTTTPATQDSQTISNTDSTTVGDSIGPSGPTIDTEVTTASTVTSADDTLLTELMSIAKTLLSEEINDNETVTTVQTSTDATDVENVVENEVDQPSLLATTPATESSSISPDATTETLQSTPTTVAMSDSFTFTVDPSQNEVDTADLITTVSPSESTTETPSTTPESSTLDSEVEVVRTNETIPLGPPLSENIESTTPSLTTENVQTTLSSSISSSTIDTTTTTQNTETTVAPTVNFELTTNTFDLTSSNPTTTDSPQTVSEQTTENVTASVETTVPLTTTITSQLVTDTSTNQPEASTVPETTPSTVNTITTPLAPSEMNVEQTTVVPTTESTQSVTDVSTMSPMTTTIQLDVSSTAGPEVTTNQSSLTPATEPVMETTTNPPSETTNIPQTTPNLENETPTVARFQDTTSTTAQGTAGSGIGQTTEIGSPTTALPTTQSSPDSSTSTPQSSPVTTTSSSVDTTTTATMTMQTATNTGRTSEQGSSMPQTTQSGVITVTPGTVAPTTVTEANMEENLVSTEGGTTMRSMETTMMDGGQTTMSASMSTAAANATETTTMQTTPITTAAPPAQPSQTPMTPYPGRFGGTRLTPAPRFSPSSTTRAPLRDYLVYGIYPNKTIVRKRPEDNLIDARNVDSPYVIFGIFPDGKLVRKFPNGTIIPDPPRNPVEVVFSLSTSTTTNRPPPRPFYNQANQGTYNQYQGPVFNNIRRPEPMRNIQSPGTVDLGLTGNAIVGPNGGGPGFTGPLGTPASTSEMRNGLVNTQMGTASVTPIVSTGRPAADSQGGRIVQDRERDEATRTNQAGGQRSSVYIGQDKFVNYWTNGASTANQRVLGVNINSVAGAVNEGPSPSVPSFENLLNTNPPGGQVTAPPGFPWRDPLDQIFGITTSSPIITASVASNTLDDSSEQSNPGQTRPVNPFVEVFTPISSAIGIPRANAASTAAAPNPSTTTMSAPTSASTMAPTTTTTTTMAPTTTTTTTMAPTTTTTTTTTTMAPTTTTTPSTTTMAASSAAPATNGQMANVASQGTVESTPGPTSIPLPSTTPPNLPRNMMANMQQQNAFGSSFDDLVFLNSLLNDNTRTATQKTLTQVEQLLANKILSLALNNPGSNRAPKAISIASGSSNSIAQPPTRSLEPIVIDLSPSSTAATPTRKPFEQTSSPAPVQVTWKPVATTTEKRDTVSNTVSTQTVTKTSLISTTKSPVTVSAKKATTPRPRTTTQAPLGLAGLLWQSLLGGGGLFGPSTTQRPPTKPKQVKTTAKSVNITPKPIQTTTPSTTTTLRTVDISKIHVSTPNSVVSDDKSVTTSSSLSTTKQPLLNNPNPRIPNVVTSTYSPEEDAKFLVSLLRAAQQGDTGSKNSPNLSLDDESFLRAILSGQVPTTTPAPQTEINNAALLAALLKAQGIGPQSPPNNIREQLLLASLGESVTSAPPASSATSSTTITTRPTSTATRPTDTTKNTVTPRPTSRPRIRTTTWSPSSTYPPPLFSSFSNYATPVQSTGDNSGNGAFFGATRAFSQFLGAAISGAAQQLQSLVRNGTKIVSEVVG